MACSGGQTFVVCSLCEEDSKIKWKCLNCDMLMCDKCKEKIHVKFKFAKNHKVLSIKEAGFHEKEIDFSNISCKNHSQQICFMFCKSCDHLVCPLCISETHNGHGLVAIREGYEIKIDKLKTGQKNVRTNTEKLKKIKAEAEDVDRRENSKLENTMKKIEAQNSLLKIEVDNHTDKLKSEIMKRWEVLHQSTQTVEKEVALRIKSLESQNSEVDDIIKSKHAERVFVDSSELINSMGQNVLSSCTKYTSIPTFLPGHITAFNVGSLENVSTRDEIKIVQTLYTEISDVFHMTACAEDMLWIGNSDRLQKVRIESNSLKIIHEKQMHVCDMVCTQSKDLLLVSEGSVLIQISDQTGEITNSKYEVKGLELTAVHVNSHGKVTVGAFSGKLCYPAIGRRVVIVMDKSGNHETTYEYDKHLNPLFTYVQNITRLNNGNICVVDKLSEDFKGRVVILSEDGDVLNTFSDPPKVKVAFKPKHAFTTPSDRIIVSNFKNYLLYVLTSSGNLIKWFDTKLLGIPTPCSLCISNSGHTYIGCVTGTKSSDNAMLYKVNIFTN